MDLIGQDYRDQQDYFVFDYLDPVHPVDPVRKIDSNFVKFLS